MNNLIFIGAFLIAIFVILKKEREYNYKDKDSVTNYLYWGYLIGEDKGIVYNKNGSFSKTYTFIGKDTDSSTLNDLALMRASLNNVLKRLDGKWTIHVEARNSKAKPYIRMPFIEPLLQKFENTREKLFNSGTFFDTTYYITYTYLPPMDLVESVKNKLIKEETTDKRDKSLVIEEFEKLVNEQYVMLKANLTSIKPLNDTEMLTYLHSCISDNNQVVEPMPSAFWLDAYLSDTPIIPGLNPKIGNKYVGVVTILSFSKKTSLCLMDKLNKLPFEYRWVTRFMFLDKDEALKLCNERRRKWAQNRKSIMDALLERFAGQEVKESADELEISEMEDEAQAMRYDVSTEAVAVGEYTLSIIVKDENLKKLDEKTDEIVSIIQGLGFTAVKETVNTMEAYFGAMPADVAHNISQFPIHTLNLVDLLPFSTVWSGAGWNEFLNAPPLIYCTSSSSKPFKLNLHQGQVGHTAIFGMTGSGKSVFLCTLAGNFKKYPDSQVIIFDKGASSQVLTAGVGGKFYNLGHDDLTFQPLSKIDDPKEMEWAYDWICGIYANENVTLTPDLKNAIQKALTSVAQMDKKDRTIRSFYLQVQDDQKILSTAIYPYTQDGSYGRYFDGDRDDFTKEFSWQVFEMETLLENKTIVGPITEYIFHRLETEMFNGRPSILILDEFSNLIKNFESKMTKWLRELRKYRVSVVFATQALTDVTNSSIKDIVLSSCPTKIYLPYKEARTPQFIDIYRSFGLNDKEIEIISQATPQREYYYKSPSGNSLFQLKLSPFELAYYGASLKEDKKMCVELENQVNSIEEFNEKWQNYKKVKAI